MCASFSAFPSHFATAQRLRGLVGFVMRKLRFFARGSLVETTQEQGCVSCALVMFTLHTSV